MRIKMPAVRIAQGNYAPFLIHSTILFRVVGDSSKSKKSIKLWLRKIE